MDSIEKVGELENHMEKARMIPIFIITCERLEVLKQSIQSYHDCIKTPFEIVIIDFGSTYMPTVEFLQGLERKGIKVYWKKKIYAPRGLNRLNRNVQHYFETHPKSNYVITDPDIALDNTDGDILDVYSHLLDALPEIGTVGPMLRINDIPDHYQYKDKVQTDHEKHFWSKEVESVQYKNKSINYSFTRIDTTFGMYRIGTQWKRLMTIAIRTMSPYLAKHLDWYFDSDNLPPDQEYYMKHASERIANWSRFKKGEA